jgi:hypothetical protein
MSRVDIGVDDGWDTGGSLFAYRDPCGEEHVFRCRNA